MLRRRPDATDAPAGAPPLGASPPVQPHKRLGDLLVEEGLITPRHLEEALAEQRRSGGFLGQILVKQGAVKQEAVASCLVKQCKIPHLSLLDYEVNPDLLALVPEEVCRRHHLLPIDKLGRILTVAMVDPLDLEALEAVRDSCPELRIKPILCNWEHFDLVAAKVFGGAQTKPRDGGITAESLGLRPMPAARPESPAPAPEPVPAPAPPAGAAAADQWMSSLRSALREALHETRPPAATAAAPIDAAALAAALRAPMQEALAGLAQELRHAAAAPAAQQEGLARELAGMVRDSVSNAMQEAVGVLAVHLQAQQPAAPVEPQALAAAIRESVSGAMQETMAEVVVQMKAFAARPAEGGAAAAAPAGDAGIERVGAALGQAMQSQSEHESRLGQIAEAMLGAMQQTTQLMESRLVAEANARDLKRGTHRSVTPFRGAKGEGPAGAAESDARVLEAMESEYPIESYGFDNFLPGSANAFTFRLSQAVAANPGRDYNPYFLYGHVGVGKTHLISAIGNAILARAPAPRVGYVSASQFARRLGDAVAAGALDSFRENYCHWDVLILDDIQFLGGRVEAQEEFFHIFNVLHQQGRQIIIAGDKAPDRLGLLEQRLVSRFSSGIVAELKVPEWETRMQILRQACQAGGAAVPEGVLALIATRVHLDVRKMTGSLRKVMAFGKLVGQDMTVEMASEILSHLGIEEAA